MGREGVTRRHSFIPFLMGRGREELRGGWGEVGLMGRGREEGRGGRKVGLGLKIGWR